MRVGQYTSSFILFLALGTYAGEGTDADVASLTLHPTPVTNDWTLTIEFPVDSDYFIKYSIAEGDIVDGKENPDDLTAFGITAADIPNHKGTRYHVVARMHWTAPADPYNYGIAERKLWVGRGGDHSVSIDEMEEYVVQPGSWPEDDVVLWLGPQYSYARPMGGCDSLKGDWIRCLKEGDDSNDWSHAYFVKPEIETSKKTGCAKSNQ